MQRSSCFIRGRILGRVVGLLVGLDSQALSIFRRRLSRGCRDAEIFDEAETPRVGQRSCMLAWLVLESCRGVNRRTKGSEEDEGVVDGRIAVVYRRWQGLDGE